MVMERPDIHLRKIVVGSNKRLCILRLHQVFYVEERRGESGVVATHFVHIQVFISRLRVLGIDFTDDAPFAYSEISQQKQAGVLMFVALYYILQDRIPKTV